MSETSEALEAWRKAARDLEASTPWTADWLRARMVEAELRSAYQSLVGDPRADERPARAFDIDEPMQPADRRRTSVGRPDRA